MLKVLEGFTIDKAKTTISYDRVIFTKGQIIDLINDIVYVRKGFSVSKADGIMELYYDPILDIPVYKSIRDDNAREVYIGTLNQNSGTIILTSPDRTGVTVNEIISSTKGIVHTESVIVVGGIITIKFAPNSIIEIYVEGYGFMDVNSSIAIFGNKINLNSNDLDGMTIRIVYES